MKINALLTRISAEVLKLKELGYSGGHLCLVRGHVKVHPVGRKFENHIDLCRISRAQIYEGFTSEEWDRIAHILIHSNCKELS